MSFPSNALLFPKQISHHNILTFLLSTSFLFFLLWYWMILFPISGNMLCAFAMLLEYKRTYHPKFPVIPMLLDLTSCATYPLICSTIEKYVIWSIVITLWISQFINQNLCFPSEVLTSVLQKPNSTGIDSRKIDRVCIINHRLFINKQSRYLLVYKSALLD